MEQEISLQDVKQGGVLSIYSPRPTTATALMPSGVVSFGRLRPMACSCEHTHAAKSPPLLLRFVENRRRTLAELFSGTDDDVANVRWIRAKPVYHVSQTPRPFQAAIYLPAHDTLDGRSTQPHMTRRDTLRWYHHQAAPAALDTLLFCLGLV
jgi:hypothetical protein